MSNFLEMTNDGADLISTNFWASEYDQRELVYLTANAGALRLLLPTRKAKEWLKEIRTGKIARIEHSLNPNLKGYFDIVFDDGSDMPFFITISANQQIDRALEKGTGRMIVYAGSLTNKYELPFEIILETDKKPKTNKQKQKYINHITINTGHTRRSPASEVSKAVISELKQWFVEMEKGILKEIPDTGYLLGMDWHNSKGAGFTIYRDEMNRHIPIIQFALSLHSRNRQKVWEALGGYGVPPEPPYLAVKLIEENIKYADNLVIPMMGDVERCIAWAYIERDPK